MTETLKKKEFPKDLAGSTQQRNASMKELFDISEEELPMKTETPSRLVWIFSTMATMEDAIDLERTERLTARFRHHHDIRMISKNRKNRSEIVQIHQSAKIEDELDLLRM